MDELELYEVFSRELAVSYRDELDLSPTNPFYASGAFANDPAISAALRSGQATVKIPFIGDLDANVEPNYSNTVFTDIAEPETLKGGKVTARVAYMNRGYRTSDLRSDLAGDEPNRAIVKRIEANWQRTLEHRAIAAAYGLYNSLQADTANKADFIVNTGTTGFDVDAFIDTEATLEMANQGSGVIVVSPQVAANMRKQRLIEKVATSDNLPPVEMYNGRIVVVATTTKGTKANWTRIGVGKDAKNLTILCDFGSFAADVVAARRDMAIEKTESTGNGGGHDTLWTRRNAIIHPQGFDFIAKDDQLTGGTENEALSPSLDDLANGKFWQLKGHSQIRFLVTA